MPQFWTMIASLSASCLLALASLPAEAAPTAIDPAEQRAQDIAALFSEHPKGYETIFAPAFLKAVPADKLDGMIAHYYAAGGRVVAVQRTKPDAGWPAKFVFSFAKGGTVGANLNVEPTGNHLVRGLILGNLIPSAKDFSELLQEFKRLPGQATFEAARLENSGPQVIAGLEAEHALALGSAFKLFILGALIEDISAGRRRWTDIVTLEAKHKSLPSGILQEWPAGSPLTLHTLATLMISRSDNTATDTLLSTLGRERVEAMMPKMGVTHPERSLPLLATRELFLLKWGPEAAQLHNYVSQTVAERRAHLARIAPQSLDDMPIDENKPVGLAEVEWFASAGDLARMLDWLRRHTETGPATSARQILAINPGVAFDRTEWPYVGYKGGSEPGVLAGAFLLRSASGTWYTLTASWNDPHAGVSDDRFFGLIQRASELLLEKPSTKP